MGVAFEFHNSVAGHDDEALIEVIFMSLLGGRSNHAIAAPRSRCRPPPIPSTVRWHQGTSIRE